MRLDVLKSEKGGYNKVAVLTKIDVYNALLMMAEEGKADRDKLLSELERARAIELPREKSGFFGSSGFSVEDTDAYIAKLEEEIDKKLSL